MSTLGLAGIASGVDTNSIVDQLMALERQSTTRLGYRRAAVGGQQSALKEIASKLAAFRDAALALKADSTWAQTQSVESSDPARVAVARTGGAGIGGHALQVDRLAGSMQRGYALPPGASGTFTVAYNEGDPQQIQVEVAAGATLQSVADTLNARTAGPVVAAVVKDSGGAERLVLSSRKTGSKSDFTVSGVLSEVPSYATPDKALLDASFTLNGRPGSSQTNVVENLVPGLRVTLKGVTAAPVTLGVGEPALDREAIKSKVKAAVNAYNSLVGLAREKLDEKPVANPTSDFQAGYGQLRGDVGVTSMLGTLRQQMSELVAGAGVNDLGDLGISVPKATGGAPSDDAKLGKLVIDDAKLTAALEADWTAVKGFLGGFAEKVETFVKTQTGGSGVIDERLKVGDRTIARLKADTDRVNERLDAKEKRMRAQFAAMEIALQNAQSQQTWLSGQLSALQTQRRAS